MRRQAAALALVLSAGGVSLIPSEADACGGFFCSQVPINQSGERIIFSIEGTTVEAHVQITYSGEAKKFSWVGFTSPVTMPITSP